MGSLSSDKRDGDVKAREPATARGRILIVDDEDVIAATLKEFLQGEHYDVATALDVTSALAQVEAFEPDVVRCDVQRPGGDGIAVLNRALRIARRPCSS
jgi:CheY-like chemotaxis protein